MWLSHEWSACNVIFRSLLVATSNIMDIFFFCYFFGTQNKKSFFYWKGLFHWTVFTICRQTSSFCVLDKLVEDLFVWRQGLQYIFLYVFFNCVRRRKVVMVTWVFQVRQEVRMVLMRIMECQSLECRRVGLGPHPRWRKVWSTGVRIIHLQILLRIRWPKQLVWL